MVAVDLLHSPDIAPALPMPRPATPALHPADELECHGRLWQAMQHKDVTVALVPSVRPPQPQATLPSAVVSMPSAHALDVFGTALAGGLGGASLLTLVQALGPHVASAALAGVSPAAMFFGVALGLVWLQPGWLPLHAVCRAMVQPAVALAKKMGRAALTLAAPLVGAWAFVVAAGRGVARHPRRCVALVCVVALVYLYAGPVCAFMQRMLMSMVGSHGAAAIRGATATTAN